MLFGIALVLLLTLHQIGLLVVMVGYLAIGIGRAAVNLVRAVYAADPDAASPES
jgi:hypothetical protein